MALSEFSIIRQYLSDITEHDGSVQYGIGDDAAIIQVPTGMQLIASIDTVLQDTHFPSSTSATDLGHKALAVNLSDMMAMGAVPKWVLLSLSMPVAEPEWIEKFAIGFGALARQHAISLIGGDISKGPLSVTVQIQGLVPTGTALMRTGAQIDDLIYVTGCLGDAGVGLDIIRQKLSVPKDFQQYFFDRLNKPEIYSKAGQKLRGIANSAIDVSDGLIADLGHILTASQIGAQIQMQQLPLSDQMQTCIEQTDAWHYALTAGDDYQLCFTATQKNNDRIMQIFRGLNIPVSCIGKTTARQKLQCKHPDGSDFVSIGKSYSHF